MPNEKNIQQVQEIRERFQKSDVLILTEYQGLTVAEVNELRRQLSAAEVQYKVFKNSLINVVANELKVEGIEPYLRSTTAVAMSNDPATPSKILRDFSRQHQNLKIKGGILGQRVIDAAGVEALINMPSKTELMAKVLGGLKAPIFGLVSVLHQGSPLTGLVNVLNGSVRQITTVLQAIAEQKKAAEQA